MPRKTNPPKTPQAVPAKTSTAKKRAKTTRRRINRDLPFLDSSNYGEAAQTKFTKAKRTKFLQHIAENGSRIMATVEAKVAECTVDYWLENDPVFRDQFNEAISYYHENTIETEIKRRAIEGVDEPVYSNYKGEGNVVGFKRVYSDKMLELLAKANIPKYRDKSGADVSVSTSGVLIVNNQSPSDSDWEAKFGGTNTEG